MKYFVLLLLALSGCDLTPSVPQGSICGSNGFVYDAQPGTNIAVLHDPLTNCVTMESKK